MFKSVKRRNYVKKYVQTIQIIVLNPKIKKFWTQRR